MLIRALLLSLLLAPSLSMAKPDATLDASLLSPEPRHGEIVQGVVQLLNRSGFSYSRRALDDALSQDVFTRYLDALDPERLFFLASDIERFEPYRTTLDNAIGKGDLRPAYAIYNLYVQRLNQRIDHAQALIKAGEFQLDGDDSYRLKRSDGPWEADVAALDAVWRQRITNDVLRLKLAGKDDKAIATTLEKRYATMAKRNGEVKSDDVFQTFMNAYVGAIEAHTAYMNPRTAENFTMQMRLSLEGIGAVLQRDDDYTIIRSVVPGGPAALSGQIKVGDRIVGVGQGKAGAITDVVGWRVDDVVELIRGPKGTQVRLDVLPAAAGIDGEHTVISLVRDKIKLEEQAAKKHIVEVADGDTKRRIGVISLPGFYEDFEGRRRDEPDFRSATRDVARLLAELQQENVEGVVLDLRNNGGGSLREAVELTGLFVDSGPVVQVAYAGNRIHVEKMRNVGAIWDGPLAVMVNRASASASEIFAGAIQDYGRGLIVGEPTFGKGTVQNLLDLDNVFGAGESSRGQLKLTVAQFFRVNGSSTQRKGIDPDVSFPATLDAEDYGESTYDNALPWSSLPPASYPRLADFRPLLPLLEQKHAARAEKDPEFRWLKEDIARYREQRNRETLSLNYQARKDERDAQEARRQQREAEHKALLGEADPDAAIAADDGLQADERDLAEQLRREKAREDDGPDALVRETAAILIDAVDLLRDNQRLAAEVYPGRAKAAN